MAFGAGNGFPETNNLIVLDFRLATEMELCVVDGLGMESWRLHGDGHTEPALVPSKRYSHGATGNGATGNGATGKGERPRNEKTFWDHPKITQYVREASHLYFD
jgi:hypothetical protein